MRGTEPIPSRLAGRGSNFRPLVQRGAGSVGIDRFKDVAATLWLDAIYGSLGAGTGLLVSATSDGGAISITLYEGTERSRSYASSAEELAEVLAAVRDRSQRP